MSELKRTPLYSVYKEWGGKTIDFGGWDLPVQFSSIKEEHEAVRTKAGLFDVSHMGEISVEGPEALLFLQKLCSNDISKIAIGRAQYNIFCYENGGIVDDLLVYRLGENNYLLVVNAANTEKDYQWLVKNKTENVEVKNLSDSIAQLALQGPLAEKVLQKVATETDLSEIKFFGFRENLKLGQAYALVSRTGYTGEDGFEIYCKPEDAIYLWNELMEKGEEEGVLPCGLGARDTLRFEATLPLYGQELTSEITPLEAGLNFAVKLTKQEDFIGKQTLLLQREQGLKRRLVGIEMMDRGIPRHGYKVLSEDKEIGFVTTGTQSPTLKKNIGLAYVTVDFSEPQTEVLVEIRGKQLKAKVIPTPFYKRSNSK